MSIEDPYFFFAPFYDFLIGDRDEVPFLRDLLDSALPEGATVLELGCGTGTLLQALSVRYSVAGLDLSAEMLKVAGQKLPDIDLWEADMTSFDLKRKFDAVICCFNSINHILSFKEWRQVFFLAACHLNSGGIFIFDVNTPHGLSLYPDEPPTVIEDDSTMGIIRYLHLPRQRIAMDVTVFKEAVDGSYVRADSRIYETGYPTRRITEALSQYYHPVRVIDPERSRPGTRSEILYFVCTLRG